MPVRRLPTDPSLDHLRNEAKTLQRLARALDADAVAAVREFHPRLADIAAPDLAEFRRTDAQLVVARRYGFATWTALRRAVEVVIRPISSQRELAVVFDVVGAQAEPPIDHTDRRYVDQERRFPADQKMMLVADHHGEIIGGGFAFRRGAAPSPPCAATLRTLSVRPAYWGLGLERRLVETIEQAAIGLGVVVINLGGARGAEREFFLAMGYHGRHEGGLMSKDLPGLAFRAGPDRRRRLDELRGRRQQRLAASATPR